LRSSRTGFAYEHFRARVVPAGRTAPRRLDAPQPPPESVELRPEQLYGKVLIQSGRFQRLTGYRHLRATECLAQIETDDGASWFGPWLPPELHLGDPGARDAALHAIQACIPHATILPTSVRRITFGPGAFAQPGHRRRALAREVAAHGSFLVYDLDVVLEDGRLVESWRGLELKIVDEAQRPGELAPAMLGCYLERRWRELVPTVPLLVAVHATEPTPDTAKLDARRARGRRAAELALGCPADLVRRPDGKPELVSGSLELSLAHGPGMTLAVVAPGAVGCDFETVQERLDRTWNDLLPARADLRDELAGQIGESRHTSATRLWTVQESLRKAGLRPDAPLSFSRATGDGWWILRSGSHVAASVVLTVDGLAEPMAFAILAETSSALRRPIGTAAVDGPAARSHPSGTPSPELGWG
ncbi:MAG: polyketide synthase dehydratase domain-containing protein, partial [Holophagales bacterium]|nr:polyketide synthase dehydratase domain-containing protein [Holophagales bacterium]